jgi:hypothetical protein
MNCDLKGLVFFSQKEKGKLVEFTLEKINYPIYFSILRYKKSSKYFPKH